YLRCPHTPGRIKGRLERVETDRTRKVHRIKAFSFPVSGLPFFLSRQLLFETGRLQAPEVGAARPSPCSATAESCPGDTPPLRDTLPSYLRIDQSQCRREVRGEVLFLADSGLVGDLVVRRCECRRGWVGKSQDGHQAGRR